MIKAYLLYRRNSAVFTLIEEGLVSLSSSESVERKIEFLGQATKACNLTRNSSRGLGLLRFMRENML